MHRYKEEKDSAAHYNDDEQRQADHTNLQLQDDLDTAPADSLNLMQFEQRKKHSKRHPTTMLIDQKKDTHQVYADTKKLLDDAFASLGVKET